MNSFELKEVMYNYIIDQEKKGITAVSASDIYNILAIILDDCPFPKFNSLFTELCDERSLAPYETITAKFLTSESPQPVTDTLLYLNIQK